MSLVAPHLTTTKNPSLIVHGTLDVKAWQQRPPTVEEARPAQCPICANASRPIGGLLGLHGHGLRDRQVRGPPTITAPSAQIVIACRRYLCVRCCAVLTVVPLGIEPRRHYGRAAICLALALWALGGQPTVRVRDRVGNWMSYATTSWRALRQWAAAAAAGAWTWCGGAAGLPIRTGAARAAQIAAGLAPPGTVGAIDAQAYAGGAALR